MNRPTAVQAFSLLAIIAGALVSYFPPPSNAVAIWSLISMFLGYGVRDLFGNDTPSGGAGGTTSRSTAMPSPQSGFARLPLLILVALIALAALVLPGCATTAASSPAAGAAPALAVQTPAQIAARMCPPLTMTVTNLQGLVGLSPSTQAKLDTAKKVVDAACGAGAVVDLSSLQALLDSGIPALQDLVRGAGLPDAEANTLLIELSVAQVVLAGLVDPLLVAP